MVLELDTVSHACDLISKEIRDHQRNLTLHYVVFREGNLTEALGMAAQNIMSHPASETARHLLHSKKRTDNSAILGTAVAQRDILFGLASSFSVLSICAINVDQFNSLKEIQREAYHQAWHALDTVDFHSDPRNRTGRGTELIVRKRNGLQIAMDNLKADIFSAAISTLQRDPSASRRIAIKRSLDTVTAKAWCNPEFYPFPMSLEATEFAIKQIDPSKLPKKRYIGEALKVARRVATSYSENNLKYWMAFVESAQDMAWRGFEKESIFSAAINTSQNTYVKATGFLVSELLAAEPASILDIRESYSPFADAGFNQGLHERMIEKTYEDIIAQGIKDDSSAPFREMANYQNEALTDGNVIGWCASALHAAGEAYETAKEKGVEPIEYVRGKFEKTKNQTSWKDLAGLGKRIIKSQRKGHTPTIRDIEEIAKEIDGLKALRQSIDKTIEDPHYQQKLTASQELDARPEISPSAPEKTLRAERTMQAAPAHIAIPGMGGSKSAPPPQQQQHAAQEETNQEENKE